MKQISLFIIPLFTVCAVQAADWAQWRGPNADGISPETDWKAENAKVLWQKELGAGYSSVSVQDGRLYTMGHEDGEDTIYCLDAVSGKPVWTYRYDCETGQYKGPRATPVFDEGRIYAVSREGTVFCLTADTGKPEWKTDVLDESGNENLRWGISTSAVIAGDLLLLNIGESGTALNKKTGQVVWKSRGKQSYASPVVFEHDGRKLAAVFSAPGLQIVEVDTGKTVDDLDWETKYDINGADPLIIGERIFISSGYNHGCALLDFSTGRLKKVWENDVMKNQFSSSIHIDGFIYGVDGQTKRKGHLRCIRAEDGEEQWSMPIGFGSLIAAGDRLIALGERGTLYFAEVDPKEYKEIHQFETGLGPLCWTPPVLADGIVYCRNDKGTLVAVDVRK